MKKTRYQFLVEIDRDPVPGWGDNKDDWLAYIESLMQGVPHYHPRVQYFGQRIEPTKGEHE